MLALLLLSCILLTILTFHFVNLLFYWRRKNVKNSLKASLIGNLKLLSLQTNLGTVCKELYWSTKEKYAGFFVLGTPGIVIKDLPIIKKVLIKDFDNFDNRTLASNTNGDSLGARMIFVEKNPIWKFMRLKISSSFSSGKLKAAFPQMSRIADNFAEYLSDNEGNPIYMIENCHRYSTDIVTSCAFGVEENCFKNDKALSREASRRIFIFNISRGLQFMCYFISPFLTKIFNAKWLDPSASNFVREMFSDIKKRRLHEDPKGDFVGELIKLENQNVFHTDPEEIIAQAAQFFLAGFETVGTTLTFALYELANNEYIQTKLRESIKIHIQSDDDKFTYKSVIENDYLTGVIDETLRKYPLLPFLDRKTKSDYYIQEDNLIIDAGTNVYVSILAIHRDPKYFANPLKFDPERFTNENKHKIIQNSYFPFGDGPRNCIGGRFGRLAVLTATAKIVLNFRISLVGDFEEIDFNTKGFLLSPKQTIKLVFHKM